MTVSGEEVGEQKKEISKSIFVKNFCAYKKDAVPG